MHESTTAGAALSQHEAVLKTIAMRLCRDANEAKDLVQDTFERALRATSSQVPENPRAWLVTIMHNLFVDRCRRKRREPAMVSFGEQTDVTPFEPEPEPEWTSISMEQLKTALASLDEGFRRVYELHCFEGASYDEIAQKLNIAKNTVGTRLVRARLKLRELLRALVADQPNPSRGYEHAV